MIDEINRCLWAQGGDAAMVAYHDHEWGVPEYNDARLFEYLTLEGAQAGLSWATILHKREGYRQAFAGFDPAVVARFDAQDIERLLHNPAIVRNRRKIESTIINAQAIGRLQHSGLSLSAFLWAYVEGEPIQNNWQSHADVPAQTALSRRLARDLKKHGFRFVGPTTCYSFLQAAGLVNDHVVGCFRYAA